ncbi:MULTISPECIES: OsmC family protein [unclassified Mucilaginibacter]|uniref:OsmC family protein n=1 Tax=unclassified Mucilaginibacter TaxID=2617802 RepID=UPI0009669FD0|nr:MULTISPECIES: OsmC family protein [unclassified Mucilaginibacter]OJW14921.1 MAG: OsmC family peroxiredoxin [Mucilaginibacter sp. 44-25]PAW93623.1 OsmC family peroxiredoxin [Mucilaginibacter sp. MD40]PLW91529.1 MAG: OsmC family peroxiredoxin [Mucilaginibacter sp.]HEK18888.1 OsmC family peroxiredoxin [Bacteroidota bacterium]
MKRTANAHWNGNLKSGKGEISSQSTTLNNTQYSFKTRFEEGVGTNPEELIAAAHAGCFTMAVSAALSQVGVEPGDLTTEAILDLDMQALEIKGIHLELKASVIDGVDEAKFKEVAEGAKANCIVSKALNVPITLNVTYA